MIVLTLEMNEQELVNEVGDIDWGYVKNAPTVQITSNAHSHTDRYYTKSDVDNRITSLTIAVDGLDEKITDLFT